MDRRPRDRRGLADTPLENRAPILNHPGNRNAGAGAHGRDRDFEATRQPGACGPRFPGQKPQSLRLSAGAERRPLDGRLPFTGTRGFSSSRASTSPALTFKAHRLYEITGNLNGGPIGMVGGESCRALAIRPTRASHGSEARASCHLVLEPPAEAKLDRGGLRPTDIWKASSTSRICRRRRGELGLENSKRRSRPKRRQEILAGRVATRRPSRPSRPALRGSP